MKMFLVAVVCASLFVIAGCSNSCGGPSTGSKIAGFFSCNK